MYSAKEHSFSKPCGNFGDWQLFSECLKTSDLARDLVKAVVVDNDLPLSVVAPFNADHPMIRNMPAFTLANASKNGTMDMLLNAGPLHNAIARLARENNYCVSGSSANMSLTGSKFALEDVQAQVQNAADLCIDYGEVPFRNDRGIGSTIIDLGNLHTLRVGCAYDQIVALVRDRLNLDLTSVGSA